MAAGTQDKGPRIRTALDAVELQAFLDQLSDCFVALGRSFLEGATTLIGKGDCQSAQGNLVYWCFNTNMLKHSSADRNRKNQAAVSHVRQRVYNSRR